MKAIVLFLITVSLAIFTTTNLLIGFSDMANNGMNLLSGGFSSGVLFQLIVRAFADEFLSK